MKINLPKFVRAALSLGAIMVASTASARAEIIYPFCKVGGGDVGTGVGSCNYASLEQCRVSSAGYGMCFANPAYVPPTAAAPATQRRAKRS
jgi:hypothetical protein